MCYTAPYVMSIRMLTSRCIYTIRMHAFEGFTHSFLHKLENSPPNITGDFIIHVIAGVMSVTSYTVEDDNGTDHVTLKVCINTSSLVIKLLP